MNIQDRIRRLQSNVVSKHAADQRMSDAKAEQASAMSEEQFTDAFKRQVQDRDAKLMAKATAPASVPQAESAENRIRRLQSNVVKPGINSAGVRPPAQQAARPEESPSALPVPRDTHAERIGQLTESGLTQDEAGRVAGSERSVHGAVSPQMSDANNTPEAKAERARRIEGMRRTEARQDNYARGQLNGHLTGREAFEERAQQEGLRPAPAAKPQGWQPISQQDFTDRAAGYGLSPEEAARAYGERPGVMRDTGNDRVLQAQGSRAQEEWLKTMPGVHRKHATNDQAQYGDGTPADQITHEQYYARIERRNQERAALDPAFARDRQIAKLAKASGRTPEQVAEDMFPTGMPQPSEEFKERQAARKAQHARANEKIWERKGYRGHLHEKTLSGDPATVREGLNRLHTITGDPAYLERIKALDAADAETAAHTRGMEKLTAEQKQALLMQDDLQAGNIDMENLQQKGAKDERTDVAAENQRTREQAERELKLKQGHDLTLSEQTHKQELEKLKETVGLNAEQQRLLEHFELRKMTHAAKLSEDAANAGVPRAVTLSNAETDNAIRLEDAKNGGGPASALSDSAGRHLNSPTYSYTSAEEALTTDAMTRHKLPEEAARSQARVTLRKQELQHGATAGAAMSQGARAHIREQIESPSNPDGTPMTDPTNPQKPRGKLSREEFRAYAQQNGSLTPAQADALYDDVTGVTTSAGQADLPPVPAGRVGPPRPSGARRSGGAWSMPTPEEVEKARADRKKAAEEASTKQRNRHPYSKE
jgi:hypothetical protein